MQLNKVVKKTETLTINPYYGYIIIPSSFRHIFKNGKVKILFDAKNRIIGLEPTDEVNEFSIVGGKVWCSSFLKENRITEQHSKPLLATKKNILLCYLNNGDSSDEKERR